MKNFTIKANIFILIFILANYITTPFIGVPVNLNNTSNQFSSDSVLNEFENGDNSIITSALDPNKPQLSQYNIDSNDKITFIIQFPDEYDYSTPISFFKEYGGMVKHEYKSAINGFSGTIDYNNFSLFCEKLKKSNIPFTIEEESKVEAELYYVSRNMNLRPYTWNTLGYDGDNKSAIAILDTGIDETHSFFSPGYGDKDFTRKIVGWEDIISPGPPSLSDENGHGTHVAGIAAGVGEPQLDYESRAVATNGLDLDYSSGLSEALPDGYYAVFTLAKFNVTDIGTIDIECNYSDYTDTDRMYGGAALYRGDIELVSFIYSNRNWKDNLTYYVDSNELGAYTLEFWWGINDFTGDGGVLKPWSRFRAIIHYPFNPPLFECGEPWKGVAPDAHIVAVRVLDSSGGGSSLDIVDGIEWVINHKLDYNITIMSMSLGTIDGSSDESIVDAVNNAVEAGIVTIVAAGNEGAGRDNIGSPGDAEKAITVAAMNNDDQITVYSSQGGSSYYGYTIKPDITAPGGSTNDLTMFSADSNDGDVEDVYPSDYFANDTYSAQGTSMATPAVAGAASLLIEAMGGRPNWSYTEAEALLVKSLLLMTATETVNWREEDTAFTPTLDRGAKDVQEGYGRINIDAAIEAWAINNLTDLVKSGDAINVWLNTSQFNPYGKHAYGGYVNLEQGIEYSFNLSVPTGADYDLYLYNATPNEYGEPIIIRAGKSSTKGQDEFFNYTAENTAKYFVVVKAVGDPLPFDEDDEGDDKKTVTIIDLTIILIIIAVIALIGIIIIIIVYKKSKNDYSYEYRPEY